MSNIIDTAIPTAATTSCPKIGFEQITLHEGCMKCECFGGISLMTDAFEIDIKDPDSGIVTGVRPLEWHERNMITCSGPVTRRCHNDKLESEKKNGLV